MKEGGALPGCWADNFEAKGFFLSTSKVLRERIQRTQNPYCVKIEFFSDCFFESIPKQISKRSLSFSRSMKNKNHSPPPHQEHNIKQRGDSVILLSFVIENWSVVTFFSYQRNFHTPQFFRPNTSLSRSKGRSVLGILDSNTKGMPKVARSR